MTSPDVAAVVAEMRERVAVLHNALEILTYAVNGVNQGGGPATHEDEAEANRIAQEALTLPTLLSHIEQGRSDRVAKLEEALREANEAILELQRDLCRATGGTMPSERAALSTQGETPRER